MFYEFKATQRIFLPIFGLIILMAGVNRIFSELNYNSDTFNWPQGISMMAYVILMIAMWVIALVVTVQRFNKNLLGDEGYLSFTLPVKTHSHINAKIFITLIWILLAVITTILSVLILALNQSSMQTVKQVFSIIHIYFRNYPSQCWTLLLEGIVFVFLAVVKTVTEIYAAVSITNFSSKYKLLMGIGAYIGFGIVENIIEIITAMKFPFNSNNLDQFSYDFPMFCTDAQHTMLYSIVLMIVFSAVYYFLTHYILSRKLNLE